MKDITAGNWPYEGVPFEFNVRMPRELARRMGDLLEQRLQAPSDFVNEAVSFYLNQYESMHALRAVTSVMRDVVERAGDKGISEADYEILKKLDEVAARYE